MQLVGQDMVSGLISKKIQLDRLPQKIFAQSIKS
jgi:hypothetical protein